MAHRYHFFRAGAVDQVSLRNGDDLLAIPDLDQKLWVALAMPTQGTDLDPTTLALLDPDKDGRVRVPDIKAAITWVKATFKTPADVLKSADQVALTAIADAKVLAAAKRVLADLGKKDATAISVADAGAVQEAFTKTVLNGDGIIIADSTDDADLKKAIEDTSAAHGTVTDRSGKPGIDQAKLDAFFTDVDAAAAWSKQASADAAILPLGDATAAAAEAMNAVAAKLDDYFARCRLAAFDGRAVATLSGQDADFQAMAGKSLTTGADDIAKLPLARIEATGRLALSAGRQPGLGRQGRWRPSSPRRWCRSWARARCSPPTTSARCRTSFAAYEAWHKAKPAAQVAGLDACLAGQALLAGDIRAKPSSRPDPPRRGAGRPLRRGIQPGRQGRLVRYQRDLGRILRNFVNFSDFYSRKDGVFQAGTLYLDGRAASCACRSPTPATTARWPARQRRTWPIATSPAGRREEAPSPRPSPTATPTTCSSAATASSTIARARTGTPPSPRWWPTPSASARRSGPRTRRSSASSRTRSASAPPPPTPPPTPS